MSTEPIITENTSRITRLRIVNFRGLKDLEFNGLQPLNVLIGPNGSGKSTVLDALGFLGDFFRESIGFAISQHADKFKDLLHQKSDSTMNFELDLENLSENENSKSIYKYKLWLEGNGITEIKTESLSLLDSQQNETVLFNKKLDKIESDILQIGSDIVHNESDIVGRIIKGSLEILMKAFHLGSKDRTLYNFFEEFERFIQKFSIPNITVYSLLPETIRKAKAREESEVLHPNGANLANVLLYLGNNHPEILKGINITIREWVPDIESIEGVDIINGAELKIMAKGLDHPIVDRFVSDGTLKIAALLVILRNPNPPPLIVIEEPENFIHPRLMWKLAQELKQAANRTQVIVTTHEPNLLNGLEPEMVWSMTRDKNNSVIATRADRLPKVQALFKEKEWLGNMWNAGEFENDDFEG